RELLEADDPTVALYDFLEDTVGRQQADRALFEAVEETFLANPGIRAAHAEVIEVLDALLQRAQRAGTVRADVGAVDVLMLLKGVCQAATAFSHIDPRIAARQLDLVRAALTPPSGEAHALRGRAPTLSDIERAFEADDTLPVAVNKPV